MRMNDLLSYDITKEMTRTPEEEWMPHKAMSDKYFAWHYWTGELLGSNGHRYFGFFCDFDMTSDYYINEMVIPAAKEMGIADFSVPDDHKVHMLQSILIDCDTEEKFVVMQPTVIPVGEDFDYQNNATMCKTDKAFLSLGYQDNRFIVDMESTELKVKLDCINVQNVMYAQDKLGKKGLIQQGSPDDFSFYYSLTNLPFMGQIEIKREDGEVEKIEVTGRGWADRQWGDFKTKEWEWASIRFADGDRVNLYNFSGGYQVGIYQNTDGSCEYFDSFTVIQNGYAKAEDNTWFSYGWTYKLPIKDKEFTVVPYTDKSTIVAIGNSFYEGLGRVLDKEGKEVGVSVNESMDVRKMSNAPYQAFQFNE